MNNTQRIEQAITALEAQRAVLGDAVVDTAIAALREKLSPPQSPLKGKTLRGERRLVTIMFADISGFTAMSEIMDPEAVRDLMNACFEHLVPVVKQYGGTVDKFIGDEIMALFGAPVAHEDDPVRALHAGLDMMDALDTFNIEHNTDLGLHFGINTGHVIAGGLGTRERQEYSVMGDAVNLGARLEDLSERGEILVGPDTYRLTAPLFEFEQRPPIKVKGKREPVTVYHLLHAKDIPGTVRGIEGLSSPLVGRDDEVQALHKALGQLRAGVGGIVTVVGEAGLGKSRLVAELRQTVGDSLQWVKGRCLSYGGSIAYLLWLDMLRGLMHVTAEDSPESVDLALRTHLDALNLETADDVYPFLAHLLALPLDEQASARLQGIPAEGLQTLTFQAIETLIQGVARQQPLILVCEDLHWADPTSLTLLEHLLALADHTPLLLLGIFRPETTHPCWQIKETAAREYRHRHTDLWLRPLSVDDGETLVDNLLQVHTLPQALRERILTRAEGNPFYVEEIIRSLIDQNAIACEEGECWQVSEDIDEIHIPDTLHGILTARIDRLEQETRRVLQLAAVIGRIFFYRVLADIARAEKLNTHLFVLQREQLIYERSRMPQLEYMFKHNLTRDAAYGSLLHRERRAYHRQVAEALERLFPEHIKEQLGLLAYHWEQAEETARAVDYLQRAAEQAVAQYANDEAVRYLSRALDLMPQDDLSGCYAVLARREAIYAVQGARENQQTDLAQLQDIAEAMNDGSKEATRTLAVVALRQASYYELVSAGHTPLSAAAEKALHLAQEIGDTELEAEALMQLGSAYQQADDQGKALVHCEQALTLARQAAHTYLEAQILRKMGIICLMMGLYDRSRTYLERNWQIHHESGSRMEEGMALNALAEIFVLERDFVQAKNYTEQGLELCRLTGNRREEAFALSALGSFLANLGMYDVADAYFQEAIQLFHQVDSPWGMCITTIGRGRLAHILGDQDASQAYLEDARRLADMNVSALRPYVLLSLGDALASMAHWNKARTAYQEAATLYQNQKATYWAVSAFAGLARVALSRGALDTAQTHTDEILRYIEDHPKLAGTNDPILVYLTCYRVLKAASALYAEQVLEAAYYLLQTLASKIEDPDLQRSYLENVRENREIMDAWQQAHGSAPAR